MRAAIGMGIVLLAGCTSLTGSTTEATDPLPPTSNAPGTTIVTDLGCPRSVDFIDHGRVLRRDQQDSDAVTIGRISWAQTEGCERFTIGFETMDGAPATTAPGVTVDFLETNQIVRVSLSTSHTVVVDQLVETELVERLFVVRALDGGLFIDFHLARPAQALATVRNSPAELVLELQGGAPPFLGSATLSDRAVVVSPVDGTEGPQRVEIRGYARTAEGQVLIIAKAGGELVAEATAESADWIETWGEFSSQLVVPAGENTFFIGEEDSEDGGLAGVTIQMVNG